MQLDQLELSLTISSARLLAAIKLLCQVNELRLLVIINGRRERTGKVSLILKSRLQFGRFKNSARGLQVEKKTQQETGLRKDPHRSTCDDKRRILIVVVVVVAVLLDADSTVGWIQNCPFRFAFFVSECQSTSDSTSHLKAARLDAEQTLTL